MMKSPKLGLIILILSLVFAGTYFIANIFNRSEKQSISAQQLPLIKLSSLKPESLSPENLDEKNNLTKALGQNLFEQIQTSDLINKEANKLPSNADINSISEQLTNSVISESLADFKLVSVIYDSDLKISPDNSKEAKLKYFEDLNKIVLARFNNPSHKTTPSQTIENINTDCFGNGSSLDKELADFYPKVVDDYLNVVTPSDLLSLHKKIVAHFKNAHLIYQALANCSQDLIKGYIAAQVLPDFAEETIAIQNLLEVKYKEINS